MHKQATWIELYRNKKGAIYQCEKSCKFIVEFAGTTTFFTFQQFKDFNRVIAQINLNVMLERIERAFDLEIIYLPQNDQIYQLEICEIYYLKDLLAGAKFFLELNTLLHELAISAFETESNATVV
ncbi:MAG: hypothetical protein RMJ97_00440 [Raineya sp.]|nr:hypothetical protein [Raineya sp.]MDW8295329.1 hypothetical protein [Raineya sp.]